MGEFVKVAKTSQIAPGQAKEVWVNNQQIALFNLGGTFYALVNECTHSGGPLSEGEIAGDQVTCPWHGAMFNIRTGEVLGPPAAEALAKYNVRVQGDDIEVEV